MTARNPARPGQLAARSIMIIVVTLVSAKAELTKDLDEKLKAANVKKSVVKLIQIDVSS